MRILALALLMTTTVSGCVSEGGAVATLHRLEDPITAHAAALAGDDVALMRATGRRVIAIYDAGFNPR